MKMTEREHESWRRNLKKGDVVCYHNRWHGYLIDHVERVTPTGIIKTAKGVSFRQGYEQGASSNRYRIEPVTDDVRASIWRREAEARIKLMDWSKLTNDQLKAVLSSLGDDLAKGWRDREHNLDRFNDEVFRYFDEREKSIFPAVNLNEDGYTSGPVIVSGLKKGKEIRRSRDDGNA